MSQSTYSLDFDGSSGRVDFGNVGTFSSTPFSISGWIKPDVVDGNWHGIIGKVEPGGGNRQFWVSISGGYNSTTNSLVFFTGPSGDGSAYSGITLTAGVWYHFLVVWNGSATKLYLDGTLGTNGTGTTSPDTDIGSNIIQIGTFHNFNPFWFDGKMDDIAIWLSDQSANAAGLASGATDPASLSPVALWRMEENTGTTTADSSGNGVTGTFVGGVSWSSDVPTPLAGGASPSTGDLSVTLAVPSLSAAATAPITGSLAATLAVPSLSSTGTAPITGTLAATLAVPGLSAAGTSPITGDLADTLPATTLTATASAPITGSLAATLAAPVLSAAGTALAVGSLSAIMAVPALSSTAVAAISGASSPTLLLPTFSSTGTVAVSGQLSATLAAPTLFSRGGKGSASAYYRRFILSRRG